MREEKNSPTSVTCMTIRDVISFSDLHSIITEDQNPGVLLHVDPYPDHETKKPHFYYMKFFIRNPQGKTSNPRFTSFDADPRSKGGSRVRVRIRIQPSK
jgi:hypothetical protein